MLTRGEVTMYLKDQFENPSQAFIKETVDKLLVTNPLEVEHGGTAWVIVLNSSSCVVVTKAYFERQERNAERERDGLYG